MGGTHIMINKKFKDNWLEILEYNKKTLSSKENANLQKNVKVPFTPLEIEGRILQELFELFYPQFINDQQNILDLIISDDENNILNAYLYRTKKAGVHESVEKLLLEVISDKIFPYKKKDLENIELFFNKLQLRLIENKKVRISSIRIFKKGFIDRMNELYRDINSITLDVFFDNFFDFIQEIYENELFYMYPNPTINNFIKDIFKFLNGIKFSSISKFFRDIIPDSKISFLFRPLETYFVLDFMKNSNNPKVTNLNLQIYDLNQLGIDNQKSKQKILDELKPKLKSDSSYYFNLNALIPLLHDIFETNFPPNKKKTEFILQKALFGVRSYQMLWFNAPKMKLFNLKRLFLRYLGIDINLNKFSHWAIPSTIMAFFNSYFGLKSQILLIYTDTTELKENYKDKIENSFRLAAIINFENGTINNITTLKKEELLSLNNFNSLETIRNNISASRGYLSVVICVDKLLLREFIDKFMINIFSFNLLKKVKVLKMIKNQLYLDMYPIIPLLKLMRNSSSIKLLKLLSAIFVDKHEF